MFWQRRRAARFVSGIGTEVVKKIIYSKLTGISIIRISKRLQNHVPDLVRGSVMFLKLLAEVEVVDESAWK